MIRKNIYKIALTVLVLFLINISALAQYASEDELKTAASEMFEEEKYVDALKLYSQLLSLYPKDASYNYKYGTCVLFGSRDKEKALKYLQFAITKPNVDPVAYYFLAKGYHHNYQFSQASANYSKFKDKTTSKEHQKYQIDREIKMCQNGERLIKSVTDIGVLSKKEIKATDFFRSYKLKGIGGKIIVKPDEFKTKLDKKNNDNSVIYLGEKKHMVLYSSYGNGGSSGKDIYRVIKLGTGDWSKPTSIGDEINSDYDEDYPFLHPDGRTLYFSSKGYNSMGGYDIFKSTLDPSTGKWSYPENLDFPINTPDDDILYISDIDNQLAYFASSRSSKQGELTVYKVTVDAPPAETSVIKGFFLAESNPEMKSATITVKDAEKDRRYGVYKTHNVTGEYLLTFPRNGGKFKILVETNSGAPIHAAVIELPVLDGFRALKQELRLVGEGDDEKLVVKNLFDESDEFDMNDPLVVENILKQRAKMDVNITEEELNNTLANSLNNALENQGDTYANLSDEQVVSKTEETASKIIDKTTKSKEQANTSYQIATEKSLKAKELYNEANTLSDAGEMEKAAAKKLEAAQLVNEVVAALAVAKTLDNEVVERESDLAKVNSLQAAVNSEIGNGNRSVAETKLAELDEIASATYHTESALDTEEKLNEDKLSEKEAVYNKARNNATELQNREYELIETVNKLEAKKAATKKKSEKAEIDASIKALGFDIEDTKLDLINAKTKETKAKEEFTAIKNEVTTSKSVIGLVNSSNGGVNSISETAKLQIENDIAYFEKEGIVGLYPSTEPLAVNLPENYNLEEHKEEYGIIDDSGEMVDYSTTHSSELAEVENATTAEERAEIIVKINESWIRDINEEIDIRKNQLKTETNPAKKTELENRIASLLTLKAEKQKEIDENTALIAENRTNTPATNNSETVNVEEEVNIMSADGSVIDYETKYTEQLDAFTGDDDFNSYTKKAAIHGNWASASEQEILLKKMELTEANEGDKDGIQNEIAVLESNLLEQQEFAALYEEQAESVRTTEPIIEEPLATNEQPETNNEEPVVEEPLATNEEPETNNEEPVVEEPIVTNETPPVTNEDAVNETQGNYDEKYKTELETFTDDDDFNSYTKKAAIHTNWAKATEDEIGIKKAALANATGDDKNTIENEIAVLESNLLEQQEFAALYEEQAELVRTTEPVVEEPLATNEQSETNNEQPETNNEEPIVEEPVVNNEEVELIASELTEENLTANNLNGAEDDYSNLKYNNNFNYRSTQSQNTLASVAALKNEAKNYKEEADVKFNTANGASSDEEKEKLTTEANDLIDKSNRKQEAIAKVYESANRNEYYNNQSVLSRLKSDNEDPSSDETIRTDLFIEESDNYYEEAKQKRKEANDITDVPTKQMTLQNAYELEMKAIEKQKMAINTLAKGTSEPVFASNENNNARNNTTEPVVEEPVVTNEQPETNNEEPVVEELLSTNEQPETNNEEPVTNNETPIVYNEQPVTTSNKVTKKDQEVILNLQPDEIETVQASEEYQTYAELKQENRRLVKEAEVEYVEAEKFQEDANDQKDLGVSLRAMAAGASNEEDKAKKLAQIEKLEQMIADNEAQSAAKKASAAAKEIEAKEVGDQSDLILISVEENDAKNFTAIEKAETFDSEFIAAALSRTATTNEEPLATNEQPEINNEEPVVEEPLVTNEQPETNNEEPFVEEPVVTNEEPLVINEQPETNNEEPVVEEPVIEEPIITNEQPETNNEEPVVVEPVTNTVPENIDVIPTVLSKSIFVINNNEAAYNDNKRIPVSPKLPEGLVFKVQIGAFRNPIPQNHFKGFAPIMAEDAGNGITRYTAGLFKTFNMANEAKGSIRSIGYNDAFVVAFLNGKRININEARAMLDGSTADEGDFSINNTPETNNEQPETNNEEPVVTNKTARTNTTEEVKDGVSTDVRNIDGVFYAIQVGVYSKAVSAGQLNNVSPLNSERTSGGLIRYTSGVFNSLIEANAAKDRIRGLGITDAFVVAYNGGTKITVAAATNLLGSGTTENITPVEDTPIEDVPVEDVPVEDTPVEDTPIEDVPVEDVPVEDVPVEDKPLDDRPGYEPKEDLNLEFKVKLGEYEEDVPVEDAGLFLRLTGRGVKNYEEGNMTIYTIGSFPDYESALDLQIEMKEMGVENPVAIVFKDGVEMPLEEALELMKKNQ